MANVSESTANFIHGLSDLWTRFFKDRNQLEALYKATEIPVGQTYLDLMCSVLNFSLREAPVFRKEFFKLLTVREDLVTLRPSDGRYQFELTDYGIKAFPFLYNKILDPTTVLEENIDFEVSISGTEDLLIFEENPFDYDGTGETIPGVAYRTVQVLDDDDNETTERELAFWAPDVMVDDYDLYLNYGYLVSRFEPSSEAYRALLQGIMQYFVLGPTPTHLTSALNVIVGLPVIRDDGEILQEVDTTDPAFNVVVTDKVRYSLDAAINLRDDILDTNNWATVVGDDAALVLDALDYLTDVFMVYDVIKNPTWWFDHFIPEEILPDEPRLRRLITPELYENLVDNPPGLVKVGDPGVIVGADDDGYIPVAGGTRPVYTGTGYEDNTILWRPTYRHSFPYILFERFLKQHAFIVEFDHDALQLGIIPFSRLNFDMQSIIVAGKSAYTYMYAEPSLNFFDDVIPRDHNVDIFIWVGFAHADEPDFEDSGLGDQIQTVNSGIIVGETALLVGDYYKYNASGAVDTLSAPWPEPLPDALGNTPVVVGGADPTKFVDETIIIDWYEDGWRFEDNGTYGWVMYRPNTPPSKIDDADPLASSRFVGERVYRKDTGDIFLITAVTLVGTDIYVMLDADPTPYSTGDEQIGVAPASAVSDDPVQLAVGRDPVWLGGESIYYWDGLTLTTQESGNTQRGVSLYLDGTDTHGIAVGDASNVPKTHHWDGAAWAEEANPLSDGTLNGIHAVSDTEAYAVGYDDVAGAGTIIEWNGTIWSAATMAAPPTNIVMTGAFKYPGTGEVGAVGYLDPGVGGAGTRDAKGFLKIGGAWYDFALLAISVPADYQFLDAYTPDNTHVWGCGSAYPSGGPYPGSIHFYNGATFALQYDGTVDGVGILNGMWGNNLTDIWAVGEGSAVVHWDGVAWTQQSFPVAGLSLTSIWGHSADNIYIVGSDGSDRYIFQTKDGGTTWITRDSETTADAYYSVAGVSP